MSSTNLEELRTRIDAVDDSILQALVERFAIARDIRDAKSRTGKPVYDPEREHQVLEKLAERLEELAPDSGISRRALKAIYTAIMREARAVQASQQVAVLGPEGTYTHMAGAQYFGHGHPFQYCETIRDAGEALVRREVGAAVVPVENSLGGSVGDTLDILWRLDVRIVADCRLPIHHNLIGQSSIESARILTSHRQPLAQCSDWIRSSARHLEWEEASSTARAVARAAEEPDVVAIGSKLAAEIYQVPILAENIQNADENSTRFLVLERANSDHAAQEGSKAAFVFTLPHSSGALADTLGIIAQHGINLTYIVSRPLANSPWEYVFTAEVERPVVENELRAMVRELERCTTRIKFLGTYDVHNLDG